MLLVAHSFEEMVFYRAWLVLQPSRLVAAYPILGAIAISMEQEIFRDPCSDRMFFGKLRSREAAAIKMPVVSLSFNVADSAEVVAIASGTDYEVRKNYRQRYLFQANVNQDGVGRLEPTQKISSQYKIDVHDNPRILCDGISLKTADKYESDTDAAIAEDGTFQVNRSFYGKRMVCQMAVVLVDDVVISTNRPIPPIDLNLVGIKQEMPYHVVIQNCLPVVEAFDADSQNITLRLAFDNNNVAFNAVNLPPEN